MEGDQPRSLRATLGRSADQISTVIQATVEELQAKRNAMAAHPSQIPTSAVDTPDFPTTYGTEWFTSVGPPGILDLISGDPAPPRSALEVDHLLGTTAASLQTADASY